MALSFDIHLYLDKDEEPVRKNNVTDVEVRDGCLFICDDNKKAAWKEVYAPGFWVAVFRIDEKQDEKLGVTKKKGK